MIVYKLEERYDAKTGKKLKDDYTYSHVICDFTGKVGEYQETLGNAYEVDYGSIDPCLGCMDVEYELTQKWGIESNCLGGAYHIDENNVKLMDIIAAYMDSEKEEPEFLSNLFRWCRAKTVERLLTEKIYTLEELGLEEA